MKVIKIINGTYGHRPAGSRAIEPKQACDAPFEIEDDKAERLVSLGIAAYVGEPVATIGITEKEDAKGVATANEAHNDSEEAKTRPDYSVEMKAAELRELLEDCGLTYKVGMTKADMVAALDAYFDEAVEDGEAPPDLSAEAPII